MINIFDQSENFDGGCMVDGGGDAHKRGRREKIFFSWLVKEEMKWKNERKWSGSGIYVLGRVISKN